MNLFSLAIATSLFFAASVHSNEFIINLKDPEYCNGVVKTEKGGVISAPCLRIQARKITYFHQNEIHKVCAEEDLMMEYDGKIFVGEKLEFDLQTRTGYLIDARANVGIWYLGGQRIQLLADGTVVMDGAFITNAPDKSNPWEIRAKTATVTDGIILSAKDVSFRVLGVPLLWLPSYKSNLEKFKDSPIRYRFLWDKGLGPRVSMRYRFYSTETFNAFARLDYRFWLDKRDTTYKGGPGGALEAEYLAKNKRTTFQTRNYGAYDKTFPDENGWRRYRFQGIFKTASEDGYTRLHAQWDKMSDYRMVGDFRDPDFEVNTQKTTYLEFFHYQDWTFANLSVRPQINPRFQTVNQELPYGAFGIRPFKIWKTGIIMENYVSGSNLHYTFPDNLEKELRNRKSGRIETLQTLYRPFSLGGFACTPRVGLAGIYYSDSPDHHAIGQLVYSYGGDTSLRFSKQFSSVKHVVEPYANYFGYTRPQAPVNSYFVFDIHDGYDRLDQLRFGLRQLFYGPCNYLFTPAFLLDLYSYSFWRARSFDERIPKVFADIEFNQPRYAILGSLGWNLQEHLLDYGNVRFLWTLSQDVAFSLEYRHRSKFWWRKVIYDNYVVDFARPLEALLASPLSDKRNTFLTKAHFRLSPRWNLQLQTQHGWGRSSEPNYNGAKVDLYTMLTGNWQMRFTYEYMPNDHFRFSYSFKLIK